MSFIINILSTPAILVGLISLFGLILQKKPVEDVVKGTVKTIVGFLVLTAGSSFLQTGSLNDFGVIFNYAFNMQGVVPNNEAIVSLGLADFASDTAYIMCIGMIANIVLARFSRLHYIFLTGPRFFRTKFSAPLVSPTVNAIVNVFSIKTAIALTVSEFPVFNPKSNPDPINLLQTNNVMEMATPSNA